MALLLAFDTATPTASVAVWDLEQARVLAVREAPVQTHGRALLPLIGEVFEEVGAGPPDLRAVACGIGPGSFTGVRVGLATAKGLAFALGVPLVGVVSLEALALRAAEPGVALPVLACLDARRGEVYAGGYVVERAGDGRDGPLSVRTWLEPVALRPSALGAAVASARATLEGVLGAPPDRLRVLGTGVERLGGGAWAGDTGLRVDVWERGPGWPDARAVAALAASRLDRGEADDPDRLQPVYLRPSDAEQTFGVDRSPH